jgi:integrase
LLAQPDSSKPWGRRDRAIIAFLVDSGMRVGDLCAINRRDIRVDSLGRQSLLELDLPSGYVRLGARAQALLKDYLASRDDHYQALFIHHKPGKTDDGDRQHRLTRQMIDRMLSRYATAAGLAVLPSPRDLANATKTEVA